MLHLSSRVFSIYKISFLTMLMRYIDAEHVLPIFTGFWYDVQGGYNYEGYDACNVVLYSYNELTATPQELLPTPANYSFCKWDYDNIEYYGNSTGMPSGFITGNYYDWEKILLNPNAAIKVTYGITCKDTGGGIWEYNKVTAAPLYECPPNTRISWDNVTREIGCTTTPTACYADIVARDLNYTAIEFFGHVGLVTSSKVNNPNVIQVLNNDVPDIYITPLYGPGAFSDIGKYWGERYGVNQLFITRLPSTVAIDIVNNALDQKNYPFTYTTLGYDYYPGGTDEHPYDCMFRCDSYLYYCYDAAGIKIQDSFNIYTVPYVIFDDFMCTADPIASCVMPSASRNISYSLFNNKKVPLFSLPAQSNAVIKNDSSSVMMIFKQLRSALLTKEAQQKYIPDIIGYYQGGNNSLCELFARCLCFELKKMYPEQIDQAVKPLLSEFLFKYRMLAQDNFAFTMMEDRLEVYLKKPYCQWLSAYFTAKSKRQVDKEEAMIAYIDQQDVVEQANLVSGSRLSKLQSLSQEKKCTYGKFFQKSYIHDKKLSEKERSLLWLGLAEIKYPADETIRPHSSCIN